MQDVLPAEINDVKQFTGLKLVERFWSPHGTAAHSPHLRVSKPVLGKTHFHLNNLHLGHLNTFFFPHMI